ncbi:unnamed protein product, partial [Cuscuta campestris]
MYPRFLQCMINDQLRNLPRDSPKLKQIHLKAQVFGNIKSTVYHGQESALFDHMLNEDVPIDPLLLADPPQVEQQHDQEENVAFEMDVDGNDNDEVNDDEDDLIKYLNAQIDSKNKLIAEKNEEIGNYENEIRTLKNHVSLKEVDLEECSKLIDQKDQVINNQNDHIQRLKKRIEELEQQVQEDIQQPENNQQLMIIDFQEGMITDELCMSFEYAPTHDQ